jgi:diguanylate cyclase (GGDEF)-like protein
VKKLLLKMITPGALMQRQALAVGYACVAAIFMLDNVVPNSVSLRMLYVFPLALFCIHLLSRMHLFVGIVTLVVGIAYSVFTLPLPLLARHAQFALGVFVFCFVGYLIRLERRHYLEIERLAKHDVLTGLKNRQELRLSLEAEIDRLNRYGTVFSLAVIDLDGFKQLNDSQGHDQGDAALRIVANVMSSTTRRTDTLARIGGDEFALLMPSTGRIECERSCSMLVDRIGATMANAGYPVTASIGATTFIELPNSADDAMKLVDHAMYIAKERGRARAIVL